MKARQYDGSASMRSQTASRRSSASWALVLMTSLRSVALRAACRLHASIRPSRARREAARTCSGLDAGSDASVAVVSSRSGSRVDEQVSMPPGRCRWTDELFVVGRRSRGRLWCRAVFQRFSADGRAFG